MLKNIALFPLLLLSGCVTYYQPPPQTVVYRDVHGLTSGVYDGQPARVYHEAPGSVANYVYYPWYSLDTFYLGYGYGYGYRHGYGDRFSFGYSTFGPSFGFSWSSGYGYPGPWYGYYYDPWYYPPYRYSWYAPYRYHRHGYDRYGWNAPYWRERHGHHDAAAYRDDDRRDEYRNGSRRNTATLDPDWQRRDGRLRQSWRSGGPGEDRATPDMRSVTGERRTAARVAMPSSQAGAGMSVRSRAEVKQKPTRTHPVVIDQREQAGTRPVTDSRTTRLISASPGYAAEVRSSAPVKARRTRPDALPIAPAPGRVVAPATQSTPPKPVSSSRDWRSSGPSPSRPTPAWQSSPARQGYSPAPAARSKQRVEVTRPHGTEKASNSTRKGGERER